MCVPETRREKYICADLFRRASAVFIYTLIYKMADECYMDGVDGVGGFEEDEEEYIEDDTIKRQKQLVAIVKANPLLWDKRQKEYSGKNFNKELAWASVAAVLGNMSGNNICVFFVSLCYICLARIEVIVLID